jgi:hypothetical protein
MKEAEVTLKFKLNCLTAYIFYKVKVISVCALTKKSTSKVIVGDDVCVGMEFDKSNSMFLAVEVIEVEVPASNVKVRAAG